MWGILTKVSFEFIFSLPSKVNEKVHEMGDLPTKGGKGCHSEWRVPLFATFTIIILKIKQHSIVEEKNL